ncbi:hypothetical protein ACFWIB_14670 [Streptomyces sp. NPDC127051]|uniref:DUF6197 family protein n=1 Tax=Streptomyces sp. NPDC127051 TaxID=3347119 RepID=UPI003652A48C
MPTRTQAAPALSTAPTPTLDDKFVLCSLAMDDRLGRAGLAFDVDTAHIEFPEILADPLSTAGPATRPGTVDEVYAEAARLIDTHGWITRYVGRADTGYCLIGAIRAAAGGNRRLEDAAETQMLERIRRQFPDVLSVGQWSDGQSGPAPVLRMLG